MSWHDLVFSFELASCKRRADFQRQRIVVLSIGHGHRGFDKNITTNSVLRVTTEPVLNER